MSGSPQDASMPIWLKSCLAVELTACEHYLWHHKLLYCLSRLKTPLLHVPQIFMKPVVFYDSLWFSSHTAIALLKEDPTQVLIKPNYTL